MDRNVNFLGIPFMQPPFMQPPPGMVPFTAFTVPPPTSLPPPPLGAVPTAPIQEPPVDPALKIVEEMFNEKMATLEEKLYTKLSTTFAKQLGAIIAKQQSLEEKMAEIVKDFGKRAKNATDDIVQCVDGLSEEEDVVCVGDTAASSKAVDTIDKSVAVVKPRGGVDGADEGSLSDLEIQVFGTACSAKRKIESDSSDNDVDGPSTSTSTRGRKRGSRNKTKSKKELEEELKKLRKECSSNSKTLSLRNHQNR